MAKSGVVNDALFLYESSCLLICNGLRGETPRRFTALGMLTKIANETVLSRSTKAIE